MPSLSISRRNAWTLLNRRVEIILDGNSLGYIPAGVKKDFDLSSGEHQLTLKTRRFRSKQFNFTLFKKEKRSVIVTTNYGLLSVHAMLLTFLELLVFQFMNKQIIDFTFILIISLIALVFSLLFHRSGYMMIREEMNK